MTSFTALCLSLGNESALLAYVRDREHSVGYASVEDWVTTLPLNAITREADAFVRGYYWGRNDYQRASQASIVITPLVMALGRIRHAMSQQPEPPSIKPEAKQLTL